MRARSRSPTLYLEALDVLGIAACGGDRVRGLAERHPGCQGAGIFCVAVPNAVTAGLGLDDADLVLDSLAGLPLDDLLARIGNGEPISSRSRRLIAAAAQSDAVSKLKIRCFGRYCAI